MTQNTDSTDEGSKSTFTKVETFMDATFPFLIWILGSLLILDAIWMGLWLPELAEYPRVLLFVVGLALFIAGGHARSARRELRRTRRKLSQCERTRDEYKELWLNEKEAE